MKKKYFILALTFLCLLIGQSSFGQIQGNGGDFTPDENGNCRIIDPAMIGKTVTDYDTGEEGEYAYTLIKCPEQNNSDGESGESTAPPSTPASNANNATTASSGGNTSSNSNSSSGDTSSWGTSNWAVDFAGSFSYNPYGDCYFCNPDDDSSYVVTSWENLNNSADITYGTLSSYNYSSSWNDDTIIYVMEYSGPSYVSNGVVYIKSGDGNYKRPSQLDPNSPVDRIAFHLFAAKLSQNLDGMNKNIVIDSKYGSNLSSINAAFTTGSTISLNYNGGYSKDLDNVNNFKSILKHEILHVDDNRNGVNKNKYEMHADVYLNQMKHTSFKNTTLDFKNSVAKSFCNYLLNIDQENMRDQTIYNHDTVILDRIKQFNNDHLGVMTIISPEFGKYITGQLSLEVKMNGYIAQPVNYTYEIN